MCGIAAYFSRSTSTENQVLSVKRMVKAMHHRGPDNFGVCSFRNGALGHTRLSVIDTSNSGKQPMKRNGVTIVYNGECYNFLDERKKLEKQGHIFHSNSDTEVLLALYMDFGEQFIRKLRGIFAFALYDEKKNILLCGRDPIGVKPLLYSNLGDKLLIASEIKALIASGLVSRDIDKRSLFDLMRFGSVPQPRTILRDVKCLLPGHFLIWKNGELRLKQYWCMDTNRFATRGMNYNDLIDAGREILAESVRLQMVSDVPLGAFLSGGIDSSLMVALMQREHGNVRTFSVGFESGLDTISEDETSDAEMVAHHLGCQHETIIISRSEIRNELPRIVSDLDHPTVDGVNSWFVSKVAANELTVAISGTGGDELFGGYPWFIGMFRLNGQIPRWKRIVRRISNKDDFVKRFCSYYFVFDPDFARELLPGNPHMETLPDDPLPYSDAVNRSTGLTLSGYTRNQLLFDIDTASMAQGLEVRVPMLDVKLLDFALSLPPSAKLGAGDPNAAEGSYAFTGVKRMLLDIGKTMLPSDFHFRAKRGFILPFDGWLRSELVDTCDELLSERVVKQRGFFNTNRVAQLYDDFKNRKAYWPQIWLLMTTELWAQQVLDI